MSEKEALLDGLLQTVGLFINLLEHGHIVVDSDDATRDLASTTVDQMTGFVQRIHATEAS